MVDTTLPYIKYYYKAEGQQLMETINEGASNGLHKLLERLKTLDEVIALLKEENRTRGDTAGFKEKICLLKGCRETLVKEVVQLMEEGI